MYNQNLTLQKHIQVNYARYPEPTNVFVVMQREGLTAEKLHILHP
jgi:hypothetical protein